AESAGLGKLRRAKGAGIETVAAADAQVLVVQHHALLGAIEAIDRTNRHARRIGAMHAGDGDGAFARHPVIDSDDAAAVDAPRHVMFLLAGGDAAVALDAAFGVADEFHSGHRNLLASSSDELFYATDRRLAFLHHRHRVVSISGRDVD